MIGREEKINTQLKKIIAEFLQKEFSVSPLVSVLDVQITNGLTNAFVYLSIFPENHADRVLAVLYKKKKMLRLFIVRKTRLKFVPEIFFKTAAHAR